MNNQLSSSLFVSNSKGAVQVFNHQGFDVITTTDICGTEYTLLKVP